MDVSNEYGLEQAHGAAIKDAELAAALEQWTDRPTMPAREVIFP